LEARLGCDAMPDDSEEMEYEWITCPCCGYKSITDTYDICGICRWEHDGWQQDNPDGRGGANALSLREAQRNYRKFGVSDKRRSGARKPKPHETKDPDWRPLN